MKYFLMYSFIIVFCSCGFEHNKDDNKRNTKINSVDRSTVKNNIVLLDDDSLLLKLASISKDSYFLKVESFFYNNKVECQGTFIDKIVTKQSLKFYHNETIFDSLSLPVKKINIVLRNKTIQTQENNLYEICIINGKRDWLYAIKGGGITDSQTEYYGLFSKQGKLLWYSYTSFQNWHKTKQSIPDDGWGDINRVLSDYGISEQEFDKPTDCNDVW